MKFVVHFIALPFGYSKLEKKGIDEIFCATSHPKPKWNIFARCGFDNYLPRYKKRPQDY
jgi:hypothetical protein